MSAKKRGIFRSLSERITAYLREGVLQLKEEPSTTKLTLRLKRKRKHE